MSDDRELTAYAENKDVDQYYENSIERFRATLKILEPEFSRLKDPVIYDVGGYGYLIKKIKEETGFTKVYDIANADLNSLPLALEDNSVDVILLCEVIEHLYDPDPFMKECHRVLKKGGTLVVTTPNLTSWYNRILAVLGYMPMNLDISCQMRYSGKRDILSKRPIRGVKFNPLFDVHIRLYNLRSLQLLMEEWGLKVVGASGYTVSESAHFKLGGIGLVNGLLSRIPTLAQGLVVKAIST